MNSTNEDKPTLEQAADELLHWMQTHPFGRWLHAREGDQIYDVLSLLSSRGDLVKSKLGDHYLFSVDSEEFNKNLADRS